MNVNTLANKVWKEVKTHPAPVDDDHIQKIIDKFVTKEPDFVRQTVKANVARRQREFYAIPNEKTKEPLQTIRTVQRRKRRKSRVKTQTAKGGLGSSSKNTQSRVIELILNEKDFARGRGRPPKNQPGNQEIVVTIRLVRT